MGIHGVFKQIGAGTRISLAKFSSDHFATHNRPLRLAIDISIWLFQIQSGKGGSNPALRTFYYRLLRLLTLNIHPLFVFDGPNKPTFKRNKKVGGPGVRVASVPEFLAKQLLKQFGLPFHIAPGEAEAECALLQSRSIVDAVLSEDVDTLMFGSGVTLRNWTPETSGKTPTHVNVYRSDETKSSSGLDRHGMILVALMSGGDYLPDGIPGCGPKLACDAARAGFGEELCSLDPTNTATMLAWRERLEHEIHTNESKYFSRKTPSFKMPEDFPNIEVLGYYTHPCISTDARLLQLTETLQWDLAIDYAALRTFTAEAFDWRCLGGAQKFIRNLAPAVLTRELRLQGMKDEQLDEDIQNAREQEMITSIHGKRNHCTTDGELEYRISFVPHKMVPIDLSQEEEDDEFHAAGGYVPGDELLLEDDALDGQDVAEVEQVKKTRQARPYDATQPDKMWIMRNFLQIGCPLAIELYESRARPGKNKDVNNSQTRARTIKTRDRTQANTLLQYTTVVKNVTAEVDKEPEPIIDIAEPLSLPLSIDAATSTCATIAIEEHNGPNTSQFHCHAASAASSLLAPCEPLRAKFKLPRATQALAKTAEISIASTVDPEHIIGVAMTQTTRIRPKLNRTDERETRTTRKKRPSPEMSSPVASQRSITAYYSPSPRKVRAEREVVSLLSSSPPRATTPTPLAPQPKSACMRTPPLADRNINTISMSDTAHFIPIDLPASVTKRRRKGPLRRHRTAPTHGNDYDEDNERGASRDGQVTFPIGGRSTSVVDALDLTNSSPINMRIEMLPLSVDRDQLEDVMELNSADNQSNPKEQIRIQESISPETRSNVECRAGGERLNPASRLNRLADAPATPRRSPRQAALKERIRLRQSVDGAWRRIVDDAVSSAGRDKRVSGWRTSIVDVLDMT